MGEDDLDLWFKREVVIHDNALTAYLRRCWPRADDVHDLRQETYARIYEAAREKIPQIPRTFIFAVARRLMIDRLRRQRIVVIDSVGDVDALNMLINDISPERDLMAYQELRLLAEALDALPPKCREVVWLRRVDDLSQREVAQRLGLSEKTVEKHVAAGMKRLADAIFEEPEAVDEQAMAPDKGQGHGQQAD